MRLKLVLRVAVLASAAAMAAVVPPLRGADVKAVLATPIERIESADYRIVGKLVRVDAKGTRTTAPVTIKAKWFPGVLRVLVEMDAPAREHVLLELRPDG
jgi:hypothetical protein